MPPLPKGSRRYGVGYRSGQSVESDNEALERVNSAVKAFQAVPPEYLHVAVGTTPTLGELGSYMGFSRSTFIRFRREHHINGTPGNFWIESNGDQEEAAS